MKLLLNAAARDVKDFLVRHRYPWADDWELTCLAKYCLLTTIQAPNGDVAGHVWFNWLQGGDRVADMHICVAEKYQGRAVTRSTFRELLHIAMRAGVRTILCRPSTPEHLSYLLRLGFESHGPFAVLPLENETHQASRPSGRSDP